jgi:hypothetical protein
MLFKMPSITSGHAFQNGSHLKLNASLLESLSPSGMPLLGCATSGMPLFSFFPLKGINKVQ